MAKLRSKFVASFTVIDPDTRLPVEVEIRKLSDGMMVGLDSAFLAQCDDDPNNPYAKGKFLVPDDETPRQKQPALELTDDNQQLAEQIATLICVSSDPLRTAAQAVHSMLDHPWLDDELRDEMLTAAARSLDVSITARD